MTSASPPGLDSRVYSRTSMFVGATLRLGGTTRPVKLRNMSETGALIEGVADLPSGTEIEIQRGRLQVEAAVVWGQGNQAGVRFRFPERVDLWLKPAGSVEQQRVDDLVQQLRQSPAGALAAPESPRSADGLSPVHQIIRLLTELEDALVNDALVIGQHGAKLQNLDLALQILRRLA